ncbi:ATP-dependent Clp protease proteolytic subunit [Thioflexithrix psekupsensis]|uniref:Peptidase S14 n=1 Tax=Thioflexithrix psekupsensis TaxID=1570016 RepID=A0A251X387_9GAMM|nr:ATP-dependent Clp protease proteolytic subunit [Thioflexithrix psekupsensis]OUD11736.1 hypothetical protein TPSD3_16945 [Thioflexithrix psekupsensis]
MLVKKLSLAVAIVVQLAGFTPLIFAETQEASETTESVEESVEEVTTYSVSTESPLNTFLAEVAQLAELKQLSELEDSPQFALLLQLQTLRYELELLKLNQEKIQVQQEETPELLQEKAEMSRLTVARDRQLLDNELQKAKLEARLDKLRAAKERAELDNSIQEQTQKQTLSSLQSEHEQLTLNNELALQKQKLQLTELETEKETLALKNAIQEERHRQQELKLAMERAQLEFEMLKLDYERAKKEFEEGGDLSHKISLREQRRIWESEANKAPQYLEQPLVDGRLIISDRRITLDGPIFPGTAAYVSDRIHYYNNKDEKYPIFLVIDNCPGGSVIEGARIIKAMQGSAAPVHVVVKSSAASMAAVIAALAVESYAYPNAIFVHHQIWSGFFGNLTQQEEHLKVTKEWSERMMHPVAEKMGLSIEEMVAKMYQNNSDGNWREFADKAVELKWINHVVHYIDETSYVQPPSEEETSPSYMLSIDEQVDNNGKSYMQLPPLMLGDVYHIYNPIGYYRW